MRYRQLGQTDIQVSEIGFGGWAIGGVTPGATSYGATDDAQSVKALRAALDGGMNFIDTSSVYGYGHSEELVGEAIFGRRGDAVVATKAGLSSYGEPADFSSAHLSESLTGSLRRLRTDHVDLFQLHNPPAELFDASDELAGFVEDLKRQGLIRAFGVSVRSPEDGKKAISALSPDALQVNFNLLDQRVLDCGLMEEACRSACSLIARTPLCFGFLTGEIRKITRFAEDDHRSRWPQAQIDRWVDGADAMKEVAKSENGQSPAQFALRYCLSFPAVASVIPGMLTPGEVMHNGRASALGALGEGQLERIRAIYERFEGGAIKPADPGKVDASLQRRDA